MIGIDMEMPTSCGKCRFATAFECIINRKFIPNHDKKSAHCPLIVLDRPKGEWKVRPHIDADGDCDGFELYCSECGDVKVMLLNRSFTLEEATERLKKEHKNFCFECGADMRGKENEVQDKS